MITKFKIFETKKDFFSIENNVNNLLMCVDPGRLKNVTIGEKVYEINWHHDCGWYIRDVRNFDKRFDVEPFPYKEEGNAKEFHHSWGAIFTKDNSIEEYNLRKAAEKFGI